MSKPYESGLSVPIFALTGRSGSGKTEAGAWLRTKGIPVVDADKVARAVVELPACKKALCDAFGNDIYPGGVLDRALLASRAFPDKAALLTACTHPFIVKEILRMAGEEADGGAPFVVVDGSTILDGPFAPYCSLIFVVHSSEEARIARIMKRDGISLAAAQKRLGAQPRDAFLLSRADYVIHNNTTIAQLRRNTGRAFTRMKEWLHDRKTQTG